MSTDIKGWDEFSAYTWLNSKAGKESIGWPMDQAVPLAYVRDYIKIGTVYEDAPTKAEPEPDAEPAEEQVTDVEYLLTPLAEFVERVIDLIRIGLDEKSDD